MMQLWDCIKTSEMEFADMQLDHIVWAFSVYLFRRFKYLDTIAVSLLEDTKENGMITYSFFL